MPMTRSLPRLWAMALLVAVGCDPVTPVKPSTMSAGRLEVHPIRTGAGPTVIHLDVYLVDVPAGSISGDEAFWRTIDEDAVGPAAEQQLLANGIRCGVAPRSRWPDFAQAFSKELNHAHKMGVDGWATNTVDLTVGQSADREDVFFFNADHQLEGRTYDNAMNGIGLTFGPTPRVPEDVRVTLCPTVRRDQTRVEYSAVNQAYEQQATDVDRIYDVGLTADVPPDGFLIVAPGPQADPDVTLGGRFLLRRDTAARREQIILVVPKLIPLSG
jgi:hypothetical protein